MLKLVGIPLFDLLVLPCRKEQMGLGDKLEKHDAMEERERKAEGIERGEGGKSIYINKYIFSHEKTGGREVVDD